MTPHRDRREAGAYEPASASTTSDDLDALTKDELLALARDRGIEASAAMTKAELRAAIGGA